MIRSAMLLRDQAEWNRQVSLIEELKEIIKACRTSLADANVFNRKDFTCNPATRLTGFL